MEELTKKEEQALCKTSWAGILVFSLFLGFIGFSLTFLFIIFLKIQSFVNAYFGSML